MARLSQEGRSLEFSREIKDEAFRLNMENAPGGCVGYYCEWCWFSQVKRDLFQVDHIIPASRMQEFGMSIEELTSIDNALILCKECNNSKQNYGSPRHGMGLAFRMPNMNLTHGERRNAPLTWEELVEMARRKGKFRRLP